MNKRICIIIPYFGKLPSNIYTFLLSCAKNKEIDWLIFSDQSIKIYNNFCCNVTFIHSNLYDIKKRIELITGLNNVNLDRPYKLCDYKPLYGIIFRKYLKHYDYWGYSDLDVVYGDLYKYIFNGVKNNYLKIGNCGHFTLFKNNQLMNNLYKYPLLHKSRKIYLFKKIVSQTSRICHFDEFAGINILCKQNNIRTYNNDDLVNEISFENLDLQTLDKRFISKCACYIWDNGHDYYFYKKDSKIYKHEYGYFHFQKRHLFKYFITDINDLTPLFSITTYGYNIMKHLNRKSVLKAMCMNRSPFNKRLLYILRWYVLNGNIFHVHIRNIFKRIFVDHNFSI